MAPTGGLLALYMTTILQRVFRCRLPCALWSFGSTGVIMLEYINQLRAEVTLLKALPLKARPAASPIMMTMLVATWDFFRRDVPRIGSDSQRHLPLSLWGDSWHPRDEHLPSTALCLDAREGDKLRNRRFPLKSKQIPIVTRNIGAVS